MIAQPFYTVQRGRVAFTFDAKFDNMRKTDEWVIYPVQDVEMVTIQCGTRIARFSLTTGKGVLSARQPGGAYNMHLSEYFGAKEYEFPKALCDAIMESAVIGTQASLGASKATYSGLSITKQEE